MKITLTKGRSWKFVNQLQDLLQFSPKNQSPKLWLRELLKRKCLDESLAQKLASSNVEFTNFYEKRALSEFGEERIERDFCKVILAIKSLRNEWKEGSIYRV